ncbi:MAG: hypothetical protein U0R49_12765 [Fimbriimonadales bacterium]
MSSLFITGFGPFGRVKENPSEQLVRCLKGRRTRILEVSFEAVDRFIGREFPRGVEQLLMIGVRGKSNQLHVEKVARNRVSNLKDVTGARKSGGIILPDGPAAIRSTLFKGWRSKRDVYTTSDDAGTYLCNYIFYQACVLRPSVQVGFLHVPPTSEVPLEAQLEKLMIILDKIEARA